VNCPDICFTYCSLQDEKALQELQCNEWDPLIDWFNKRFGTSLQKTMSITPPHVSDDDKMKIAKHFHSFSLETLHGNFNEVLGFL